MSDFDVVTVNRDMTVGDAEDSNQLLIEPQRGSNDALGSGQEPRHRTGSAVRQDGPIGHCGLTRLEDSPGDARHQLLVAQMLLAGLLAAGGNNLPGLRIEDHNDGAVGREHIGNPVRDVAQNFNGLIGLKLSADAIVKPHQSVQLIDVATRDGVSHELSSYPSYRW